jgi:hypothetical protein
MHIHGNSMAVNAASFYSAGQNERTAAARRAADVRKKLMKAGSVTEGAATSEETLMIGQWMDARHNLVQSEDAYRAAASGRDLDFV